MERVTAMDRLRFEPIATTVDRPKSWPIYNGHRLSKGVSPDYTLRNTAKISGIGMLRETILTSGWRNFLPTSKARSASLGGDFRSVSNGRKIVLVDHTGAKGVHTIDTPTRGLGSPKGVNYSLTPAQTHSTALILRQYSETLYCPFTKNNPNNKTYGLKACVRFSHTSKHAITTMPESAQNTYNHGKR